MKWATKPMKGLERGLTDSLQWKEEHKGVVLGLTREEEEEGAGTPCSGLHTAPNQAQTKRLSQPYKNPDVRGSDGEQMEGKKEEEEEGFQWLTQAPEVSSTRREERGWDGPLRAPIFGLDGRWSGTISAKGVKNGGQLWRRSFEKVTMKMFA